MSLKFLTLYANQLDRTVAVYEALGLKFEEEKHGDGPMHFSYSASDLIIEIYPAESRLISETMMVGFEVENLAAVKPILLDRGATILKDVAAVKGALRMILEDPDGRKLYVQQIVFETLAS